MSDSVLRAIGYGWTVGVCFVHRMSEKVFDKGDCEPGYTRDKMADPDSNTELDVRPQQQAFSLPRMPSSQTEPDLSRHTADHSSPGYLHYDSMDETGGRGYLKGRIKGMEMSKLGGKETRVKHNTRNTPDPRWNTGSVSAEPRWTHSDKLEKSQNDLSTGTNSRWAEVAHKSQVYGSNSSESDVFPSKSVVSNHPNDVASRPAHLFKSCSSSQLPCPRTPARPGRYPNTTRPISLVSMQQTLIPLPVGHVQNPLYMASSAYGRNCCGCNCDSLTKRNGKTESVMSLADDPETREGLSWRRLHMSRAKLKATATTSELLSGFAMVAMVELQINKPTAVPEWLFVLFAVCTTVLVSVHIFALMISTYLLPNIDAVSKLHVSSLVTESPHDRMKGFIELAWAFSTILGLFLFLVEIAILCWVKFWDYSFYAAMSATMIVIPVLIVFVAFAMHFYHSLVVIKCKTSVSNIEELENMKKQLDSVTA